MKLFQLKFKLPATKNFYWLKCLYPITILLVIIGLTLLLVFLYRNVYLTLSQAEIVTMLKKEAPEQNLEKNKLMEIIEKLEAKSTPQPKIESIRNPFLLPALIEPVAENNPDLLPVTTTPEN